MENLPLAENENGTVESANGASQTVPGDSTGQTEPITNALPLEPRSELPQTSEGTVVKEQDGNHVETPQQSKSKKSAKRSSNKKRKKSAHDDDYDEDEDEDDEAGGLQTVTKSGRKVQKPSQWAIESAANSSANKSRKTGRRPENAIVCMMCNRGHSPKGNRIVLCDDCDRPFHQLCHKPLIDDEVVNSELAAWSCSQCFVSKGLKKPLETGLQGSKLTLEQRKKYLLSLSTYQLVDLILKAEEDAPFLALYPPSLKSPSKYSQRQTQESYLGANGSSAMAGGMFSHNRLAHEYPGSTYLQPSLPPPPPSNLIMDFREGASHKIYGSQPTGNFMTPLESPVRGYDSISAVPQMHPTASPATPLRPSYYTHSLPGPTLNQPPTYYAAPPPASFPPQGYTHLPPQRPTDNPFP
ncbi:uncharacterized protein VTP21DRAFT_9309 [Calcarisporiella thermophila]|uniref:uncharacterized protein n=1 Tax=Calcarisporiella thermophila TaxID=911321 RepID=UPI0037438D8F